MRGASSPLFDFYRSLFSRLRLFSRSHTPSNLVHTCGHYRLSQSTQTHSHASEGKFQKFKNNIHGNRYQGVAEQHPEVSTNRYTWPRKTRLTLGRRYQRIHTLTKPAEIEPSQNGAHHQAARPQRLA